MILFCYPSREDISAVKGIIELFGQASGLRVNYTKSTATLIRCEEEEVTQAVQHLGCPIAELPIISRHPAHHQETNGSPTAAHGK
jgi:hypothetical protein